MIRLLRAMLAVVERALDTPTPEPVARECPGCRHPLDFMCREVACATVAGHVLQEVRCVCGEHSVWDWDGGIPAGIPYLMSHARPKAQAAA